MAEQEAKKKNKSKTTKLVDEKKGNVKFVPPGKFKGGFSKDTQLGRAAKAPKGGRR